MKWRDLFTGRKGGLDSIEQHLLDMLEADGHTFALATSGVLGSADPAALRQQASDSDHRVNLLVQQVRRELVVHASLHGVDTDVRAMFATMSIVKDIERVGDYAKQLLRLARMRGPFPPDSATHAELSSYSERIAGYLSAVRDALGDHDVDLATATFVDVRALTDELNAALNRLLAGDPAPADGAATADGAARALAYHYLARITAHLGNVLTSIISPLDMLDFYDEAGPEQPAGSG